MNRVLHALRWIAATVSFFALIGWTIYVVATGAVDESAIENVPRLAILFVLMGLTAWLTPDE